MPENNQTVIDAFTEMAPRYDETVNRELTWFWGVSYDDFVERVLSRLDLSSAGLVLDVGTGQGAIPLALTRRSGWQGRAVGLDITPEMLRGARQKTTATTQTLPISLIAGSGVQLPFAANSFDAVICALATHHMDVWTLLSELRRVLHPGGEILLADVAFAPFWRSRTGGLLLRGMVAWYGITQGSARVRAEFDAMHNMLEPNEWQARLFECGFPDSELTVFRSRRRWYPSGVLINARAG